MHMLIIQRILLRVSKLTHELQTNNQPKPLLKLVGHAETGKRRATRIDDEYVPTLEEYTEHLESLDEVALEDRTGNFESE